MEERRKDKRTQLPTNVIIKKMLGSGNKEVEIEVIDLSRSGLGFSCKEKLEIGEVYESFLTIWTKEVIHAFLEIRRIEKIDDGNFNYGAIFIGMPEMDAARIEVYQTVEEHV